MELSKNKKSAGIRRYLIENIKLKNPRLIADAIQILGITRQAVHRHLHELVKKKFLVADGNTKARIYKLGSNRLTKYEFDLKNLEESEVYFNNFRTDFSDLPKNIESICHYGFTEILNNAIDHSGGIKVKVTVARDAEFIYILIVDDGEGIFNHIARLKNLRDPREAIFELSKGKLTTDPKNHTGQGIFFTSRAFDEFVIKSGDLKYAHKDGADYDFLFHEDSSISGTRVRMIIALNSERQLKTVFGEFTGDEEKDYAFNKTIVPVKLALYECESLVSRSQAKRILNRVEKFETVILDFSGVESIGQAFADEVFRVFARRHPNILFVSINQNEDINKMIVAAENYKD